MRKYMLASCLVATIVGIGSAQRNTAGWLYTNTAIGGAEVAHVTAEGVVKAVVSKGLLSSVVPSCIAMDRDNLHCLLGRASGGLLRIDLAGTVKETICTTAHAVTDVCIDGDGSYIVTVAAGLTKPAALLKVTATGQVTTLCEGAPLSVPVSACVDVRTGDYVILDGAISGRLIRVSRDGASVDVFARLGMSIGNTCRQDLRTGEFLVCAQVSPTQTIAMARVSAAGVVNGVIGLELNGQGIASLACDRVADAAETVCVAAQGALGCALYTVERATKKVEKVVDLGTQAVSCVEAMLCRELQSTCVAPGQWDIDLKVVADGNLPCVFAGSLRGSVGFRLPDQRCIALTPDILTQLCVQGGLQPFLSNTTARLDLTGRATARLDITSIPFLIGSGVRVWFTAVTLDANASFGIKTICDPIVICL